MSSSCCQTTSNSCETDRKKDSALFLLRITLGVIFLLHGAGKLFNVSPGPGMEIFTSMIGRLGFPFPALFAYAAALTEFLGGLAMLTGIMTRFFSIGISIVMLVALIGVKKFNFPASDVDLALLAIAITIHVFGPGAFTLKKAIERPAHASECEQPQSSGGCCGGGCHS